MRAYVYNLDHDDKEILGSGRITKEYKSEKMLMRYGVILQVRKTIVHIISNWNDRYKTPDKSVVIVNETLPEKYL